MSLAFENTSNMNFTEEMEPHEVTTPSVFDLAEDMWEYKTSIYIFTFATIPVAVWGWIGNFLSFR